MKMKLIRTDLFKLLLKIPNGVSVKAAFAYGKDVQHGDGLLEILQERKASLRYWASFDAEQSTSPDFLEKILQFPQNQLYLVRMECGVKFHPKVLYIENFGVYIGSANMTESGIYRNIELGVFLTADELKENSEFYEDLREFFHYLEEGSTKALPEDIEKYRKFCTENTQNEKQEDNEAESAFDEQFSHIPSFKSSFACEDKKTRENKKKAKFVKEWRETLGQLRSITDQYFKDEENYPLWMKGYGFSPNIVCDRFLHYFYEEEVMKSDEDGNSIERVKIFHMNNKKDPEDALKKAISRFQGLQESYDENTVLFMDNWAKDNKNLLSKEKIQNLTEEELKRLYEQTHALRDHARHMENHKLKLKHKHENESVPGSEKAKALASIHFHLKIEHGKSILDALEYLIWGNDDIENRIWEVCYGEYQIPDIGKSSVGEFVGWALPEEYPIRNGRTNKALRALGYDIIVS